MGNKIDLAIIKNCSKANVKELLHDWMTKNDGNSDIRPNECVFSQQNDATVALLNYDSCLEGHDGFFPFVSERTNETVLTIYVYDSDYWGYCLYDAGKEIDTFCTCPELLWSNASKEELQRYSGNSAIIARYFNVSEGSIKNYLIPWTEENREVKAYPDDEHEQEDWQILDFMAKLGYEFPEDEEEGFSDAVDISGDSPGTAGKSGNAPIQMSTSKMKKERPKRTLLQKQNDRLSKIFFTATIILLVSIYVIYQSAEPPSADVLQESLEAGGYEVFDITEQFSDDEYVLNAFGIDTDSLYIEFYEVDSKNTATSLYNANVSFLKGQYRISSENRQGTDHCQRNYLTDSDTFYAFACYENTFLYAYTDKQNESGRDAIKEIAAVFMPPNLTIILVLFGAGSLCLFLGFGFVLQEKRKRTRCNVLTTATVIGNEKKRTTNMEKDRGQNHYGASAAYSYSPVVSYYANSELFEETYGNGFVKPIPMGTKVEILYNGKNPEEFCFADEKKERPFLIVALLLFLAGLVLCGISVYMLLKAF